MFPCSPWRLGSRRNFGMGFGKRVGLPAEAGVAVLVEWPARCGATSAGGFASSVSSSSGVRSNFLFRLYSSSFPMPAFYPTHLLVLWGRLEERRISVRMIALILLQRLVAPYDPESPARIHFNRFLHVQFVQADHLFGGFRAIFLDRGEMHLIVDKPIVGYAESG